MENQTTEQNLAARARRGDSVAQMELYDRYFAAVFRSARRVVGSNEEAEEVAQESFLKFFSAQGEDPTNVVGTLRRIAINASIDTLRKRKIDFAPLTIDLADLPDEPLDVSGYRVEQILKEIKNLKDPYRTTLKLNVLEGLTYDEIAGYLKVETSTVRSHISRAKQIIAKRLNISSR